MKVGRVQGERHDILLSRWGEKVNIQCFQIDSELSGFQPDQFPIKTTKGLISLHPIFAGLPVDMLLINFCIYLSQMEKSL